MAVILPYTFRGGAVADADELNAQFDVLYDWINNEAKHKDTINPFTKLPSLPINPSTANHMTRMAYSVLSPMVDNTELDAVLSGTATVPSSSSTTEWSFEAGWKDVALTLGTGVLVLTTGFTTCLAMALCSIVDQATAGNGERVHVTASTAVDRFTIRSGSTTRTERFTYIALGF